MDNWSRIPPSLVARHNINVLGDGPTTLVLLHGYGCNQLMWRHVASELAQACRIVMFDLAGFGLSDFTAYDEGRHATLEGHARDLLEVLEGLDHGPAVLVGHSVGAMIGLLAEVSSGGGFAAHVMVSPSPCFRNEGDYRGGFEAAQIDELLQFAGGDMDAWAAHVATLVVGRPAASAATQELFDSFCRAHPRAAVQLATAAFGGDYRAMLARLDKPALILQCSEDAMAPLSVGGYMHRQMPGSTLRIVENRGHCPHLTNPDACLAEIRAFLSGLEQQGILPGPRAAVGSGSPTRRGRG